MTTFAVRTAIQRSQASLSQLSKELGISETAMIAGYSHPANFITAFRKRFAVTPSLLIGK